MPPASPLGWRWRNFNGSLQRNGSGSKLRRLLKRLMSRLDQLIEASQLGIARDFFAQRRILGSVEQAELQIIQLLFPSLQVHGESIPSFLIDR